MTSVRKNILDSIDVKLAIAKDRRLLQLIETVGQHLVRALIRGNQVIIAGNGGSAADAQHFAAELSGKFLNPTRRSLSATALTTNTSNLTAIGNDFGYEYIFSRQIAGIGRPGDIFIGISTSGNSLNILEAFAVAREKHILTIGLLGGGGGSARDLCDLPVIVPSSNTQHIQEAHITIIHALCGIVDGAFENK